MIDKIIAVRFDSSEKMVTITDSLRPNQKQQIQLLTEAAVERHQNGQLEAANLIYETILEIDPANVLVLQLLGVLASQLGQHDVSLNLLNKAISLKPDYADALNNRGIVLKEVGNFDEALVDFNKALNSKPDDFELLNNRGIVLTKLNSAKKALADFNKALSLNPENTNIYNNRGNALKNLHRFDEALDDYNKALSLKPDNFEAQNNKGVVLHELLYFEEALSDFKRAISIKPNYADAFNNLGNTMKQVQRYEDALDAYNKAILFNLNYAEAFNNRGNIYNDLFKPELALSDYEKAVSIKPDYASAHRQISLRKSYTGSENQILVMEKLLKEQNLEKIDQSNLFYALAKAYEDQNELGKAFKYFEKGGKLRKETLNYNIRQDALLFRQIKSSSLKIIQNSSSYEKFEPIPIFIIGMPRSGTTLTEQIISSHSKVTGAGELKYVPLYGEDLARGSIEPNKENINEFREKYLSNLAKLANRKSLVTDKLPHNFRFIPLICSAFPEAKIIHVQRDPKATCWSNYKHYFVSTDLGYCYNLTDVVDYYKLYNNLMQFWQSQYDNRIYKLDYEKLTTDQDNETRQLIKHLGIEWEDACLSPQDNIRSIKTASQQQVRQKVYQRSSAAWRKYEPFVSGAFDTLTNDLNDLMD